MKNAAKKQPRKKRVYVKKKASPKWVEEDSRNYDKPKEPLKKDTELEELAAVVSIFDNWNGDQKTRNIRFLASKYWDYLKDSSII